MGGWWGKIPGRREERRIDILLNSYDILRSRKCLFADCSYEGLPVDENALPALMEKSKNTGNYWEWHYVLFARAGFTPQMEERARREKCRLFTLGDLYRPNGATEEESY